MPDQEWLILHCCTNTDKFPACTWVQVCKYACVFTCACAFVFACMTVCASARAHARMLTSFKSTTQRPTNDWLKEQPTSLFFSFMTAMSATCVPVKQGRTILVSAAHQLIVFFRNSYVSNMRAYQAGCRLPGSNALQSTSRHHQKISVLKHLLEFPPSEITVINERACQSNEPVVS
eukprot:1160827-Pelagomonas_calceolata.AAC.15